MTFRTEIVGDIPALAALAEPWRDLWGRVPGASPFTAPEWLLPWCEAFRPADLRVVAVWRGPDLAALLPLWREAHPDHGRRLLPLGIGLSDLFDLLADPAELDAPAALSEALRSLPADWDSLSLENLPEGAAAFGLPAPSGWTRSDGEHDPRPVLPLGGPDGLAFVPGPQRRKLRMTRNRVARGRAEAAESGPDDAEAFLADLVRLHELRWASRDGPGVLADPAVRRFHALSLPRLLGAGLARATRLLVDGRAIGAYYGLQDARSAYAYVGGFDPAFGYESPGAWLLGGAIEEAASQGRRSFDFLRGREAYKYAWGAVDRPHRRFVLARP